MGGAVLTDGPGGRINAAISRVAATGHCGGGGFSVVGLNDGGLDSGT